MAYVSSVLLLLFTYILGSVRADYFIDSGDTSVIRYTHATAADWGFLDSSNRTYLTSGNNSVIIIDFDRLYNGTVTFAHCNLTQLCQISIPFTGSGITLFGGSIPGMYTNFTVTLDGIPAPPPTLQTPPARTSPYRYNVTLYDLQSVQVVPHMLTINLVEWAGYASSEILFDAALINETVPATRTSSIPASTSTASSSQTSARAIAGTSTTKSRPVLAIALGTSIGVLALVIAVGVVLFYRNRAASNRASGQMTQTGGGAISPMRPDSIPYQPYPASTGGNSMQPMYSPPTPSSANTGQPLTPMTAEHFLQPQPDGYMYQPPPSPPFQQPYYGMQPPPGGGNMGGDVLMNPGPDYGQYRQNAGPVHQISQVMNMPGQARYPEL